MAKLNEETLREIWKELRQPDWSPSFGPLNELVRGELNELHKNYGDRAPDALRAALKLYGKDDYLKTRKGVTLNYLLFNRPLGDYADVGLEGAGSYGDVSERLQLYADSLDHKSYEALIAKHRIGALGSGIMLDDVPYAPVLQHDGNWLFKVHLMKQGDTVWMDSTEVCIAGFPPEGVEVFYKENPDYRFTVSSASFTVKEN